MHNNIKNEVSSMFKGNFPWIPVNVMTARTVHNWIALCLRCARITLVPFESLAILKITV